MHEVTLPVMRPRLPPLATVTPYLERMYASGVFANRGPLVRELEDRYAARFDVTPDQVVAVANGTVGLAVATAVSEVDCFLVPEWTFPATALGPSSAGVEIRLRDVHPDTWLVNPLPTDIAEFHRVGLLPVQPFGTPIDLAPWSDWRHVVIDAAASVGTPRSLRHLPADWAVVVSLHATKVLGCGEGGFVIFGDADRAARARQWINFGFSGDRIPVSSGTNGKPAEAAAAFALAALDDWPTESAEWQDALRRAAELHAEFGLGGPGPTPDVIAPYWIAQFESPTVARRVETVFADHGIGTRRWWPAAISASAIYAETATSGRVVADSLASTVVGLPLFRGLDSRHVATLTRALAVALEPG
jgi:dTDP-4-amino-4,6-dideoxygalactose transaminase